MRTSLDCIPCFIRQALDAVRMLSANPNDHERIVRDVLAWTSEMDLDEPPPVLGQRIHRRLREIAGVDDPYRAAKDRLNSMALSLLPELRAEIEAAPEPLATAVRLAIAGNVIDMGLNTRVTESDVRQAIGEALAESFFGEQAEFQRAVAQARKILYLADNAGEIVFDRLLIERLSPARVTLAVRGAAIINDATMADAQAVGLHEIVEVIDNGSDAPGTVLADCSDAFVRRFNQADLILAKGQGNYETLNEEPRNIFFLFKAKCAVIADHIGLPLGTHVLTRSGDKAGDSGAC
jgi:uncharacterized protein with ATP-grasp and redox domains